MNTNSTATSVANLNIVLNSNKGDIAFAFLDTAKMIPRFDARISKLGEDLSTFVEEELNCIVDYLVEILVNQDSSFTALYIGEKAKMAYSPGATAEERNQTIKSLIEKDRESLLRIIDNSIDESVKNHINSVFDELISEFNIPIEQELKIIFIGDCLFLDVVGFLMGFLIKRGIGISPHFVTDKNPHKLRMELTKLSKESYDIVFYSPFSYQYSLDFGRFLNWKDLTIGKKERESLFERIFSEITPVVEQLSQQFSMPIFIHNSAAILRAETSSKYKLKNMLTSVNRSRARKVLNSKIDQLIEIANSNTHKHVYKFDETVFLKDHSASDLGQYFYYSKLQHPAKLGALIAESYQVICETIANLNKKKLVVCDLDNTLWEGVIGEGSVKHYIQKQTTLKRIKSKGIVLAIASKNDPANVHWDGGILSDEDFVFKHINWEPKITAFPNMQNILNMNIKDFIFIDDRADERDFVKQTYPEITVLDALDDRSWEMIALWESMLDDKGAMDRTKLYKERAERNKYVDDKESDSMSEEEMFASLGLTIDTRKAGDSDIERATELINRTNQFNMQGSRTTLPEMKTWFESEKFNILTTSMTDKFGDMGCISVLIAEEKDDCIEIPIFVLSCRVFGYHAETVILNWVKKLAKEKQLPVKGIYLETMYNGPCKDVYEENGFQMKDDVWVFSSSETELLDPVWFN